MFSFIKLYILNLNFVKEEIEKEKNKIKSEMAANDWKHDIAMDELRIKYEMLKFKLDKYEKKKSKI